MKIELKVISCKDQLTIQITYLKDLNLIQKQILGFPSEIHLTSSIQRSLQITRLHYNVTLKKGDIRFP